MEHIADKICSCNYCLMLDCMFGDPELNQWEKDFIDSVCRYGWRADYTDKQKAVIKKTFQKMLKIHKIKT